MSKFLPIISIQCPHLILDSKLRLRVFDEICDNVRKRFDQVISIDVDGAKKHFQEDEDMLVNNHVLSTFPPRIISEGDLATKAVFRTIRNAHLIMERNSCVLVVLDFPTDGNQARLFQEIVPETKFFPLKDPEDLDLILDQIERELLPVAQVA